MYTNNIVNYCIVLTSDHMCCTLAPHVCMDVVTFELQVRGEYSGSFWRTCFEVIHKEGE